MRRRRRSKEGTCRRIGGRLAELATKPAAPIANQTPALIARRLAPHRCVSVRGVRPCATRDMRRRRSR
ncbi:hypothetical protein BMA721280_I0575 [Burkholderia mallei 2002721280]|nr:hypothetical protein BMA721280_I0575 [Burkholderia mallei 2002721280]